VEAGILALLCLAVLSILVCTGWLPGLEQELSLGKRDLFIFLALSFWFAIRLPLSMDPALFIHPGIFSLFLLFFILLKQISPNRLLSLVSFSICTSSILFIWHEMFRMSGDWSDSLFRTVTSTVIPLGALAVSNVLGEKMFYLAFTFLSLHLIVLYFHREALSPVVIGEEAFLDAFWLALTIFVLLLEPIPSLVRWIREGGFPGIRKR
jgi:hypothetical protein